jgi:hypothetical protein
MKSKRLAIAAVSLCLCAAAAQADQLAPVAVGTSFTDVVIGTITVTTLSKLSGNLFALDAVTGSVFGTPVSFSLQPVSFSSASVGSLLGDADASAAGFSFSNVGAGSYVVKASGFLSGTAQIQGTGFVGANFSVTAVPEPESYALMLAGLGLVGVLSRRRKPV